MKTTLSDRVLWYKAWHDDIQLKSKAKAPLSSNAVANRLNAISKQVQHPCKAVDIVVKVSSVYERLSFNHVSILSCVVCSFLASLPCHAMLACTLQPYRSLITMHIVGRCCYFRLAAVS